MTVMKWTPHRLVVALGASACMAACSQSGSGGGDFSTPGTVLIVGQGNNQTAAVGQAFALPLQVEVLTPDDNKCDGCTVQWQITPGGFQGSGSDVTDTTNVVGQAGINIEGIPTAGEYTVSATIANGDSVDFSLTVNN